MVAIVAGSGLGLERTSGFVLGSRGMLGQAAMGRAGENVFVNAATGNLVIQRTDEMLLGRGEDAVVSRTYNSLGNLSDDNGDNWRASLQRRIYGLTGTVNTAGSTVSRTDWDGAETVFTWDATRSAYVSKEGAGAYDTITYAAGAWSWRDGDSRVLEAYDAANGNRLATVTDADGNVQTFTYNVAGLVSRVTNADGGYTDLTYAGTLLTQVVTCFEPEDFTTFTRVRYGYDAQNRLSTVTVDRALDNSIADGATYVTTYTYDGTSKRVASITQNDGSKLQIAYVLVGADYRVSTLTETVATGVTRVTGFAYDTVTRVTTVTDPAGQATALTYDVKGQLTQVVAPPAVSGGAAQTTSFTYNANGDVLTANLGPSNTTTYGYDTNGNMVSQRDQLGNTVTRTYGAANQLLTETRYLTPDPDGAGAGVPTAPLTGRYAYDAENHLRFSISAEGRVVEYQYNAVGQRVSVIEYVANLYNVGALTPTDSPSEATVAAWVAAIADKSGTKRTDTTYDFRGAVATTTSFGKVLASGAGDTLATTEITRTIYIYDQAGRLLSRKPDGSFTAETFLYDGLGRLIGSTDIGGVTTTIAFADLTNTTTVTLGDGATQTSVYNKAGELLTYTEAGVGVTTAVSGFKYDTLGRLRIVTDATGVKAHILYDRVGRKVAEIDADGSVKEFAYNANDRLISTVRYKTQLTPAQLATLVDGSGNPTAVELDSLRPSADAADIWEWRIYDTAQRLIQTIDGVGALTNYQYDGASRLIGTVSYANMIAAATVATYKTTPPTTLRAVTANATADRVVRNFYDADGLMIGSLDSEGYLIRSLYDGAGQKIETVAYATATTAALRAAGSFADLLTSVTTTVNAADIHGWNVYDARGYLRAAVDGEGNLTRYHYTPQGHLDQEIRGQKLNPATLLVTRPTLANLPAAPGGTVLETTAWTRNLHGDVLTETRTLASGTETDTYSYDSLRRLVAVTRAAATADARTESHRYDKRGRLTGTLSGEGSAALAALGATPTQAQIDTVYATWGTTYVYDAADRLTAKIEPNGTSAAGLKSLYYYNTDGLLTHTVNALGEVIEHRYDTFGRQSQVVVYAARIAAGTLATLTGGLVTAALTTAVTGVTNAAADSVVSYAYNVTGTLEASTDALGATTAYGYNSFGELIARTDQLDTSVTVQTSRTYDRRGMMLSETRDSGAGGLQIASSATYDAFGRAVTTTDANGRVRSTGYDRAGRTVLSTDALGQTTSYSYDGRDNMLTVTDRLGKTTTFAYTAFSRQITVTTAEGVVTTTQYDAHDRTLSITDGAGRTQGYTYDKDGQLKTATVGGVVQLQNTYDSAGKLSFMLDALGAKTSYAYDGANRVLTIKVDDGGLNLITTYAYDAKGQRVTVTDPAGMVTTVTFDKKGQHTAIVVNTGGLALRTEYTYDKAGRTLTRTEGAGTAAATVTQFAYDKADRLISTRVNPTGLNLTTTYSYDKVGNVVARTDAAGKISRYVYDAQDRLTWSVDEVGAVSRTTYDAEGRVVTSRGYAATVPAATLAGFALAITEASITAAVATSATDGLANYVYDGDGRLRFTIDALGRPVEYVYDGAGNVIRSVSYAGPVTVAASYSLSYVQTQITSLGLAALAGTRTSRAVFDAANRQAFSIDAQGLVTAYSYDAAGKVVKAVRYAPVYATAGDPTLAAMQTWATTNAANAGNRVSRSVYDRAGRAVYAVDAEGYVFETQYDAADRVTKQIRYAAVYAVNDTVTKASLATLIGALPATALVTSYTYDSAGRLTDITDPLGTVTRMVLDALGQATDTTRAYGTADAATTRRVYDAAGRVTAETQAYGTAQAATTGYTYDGLGRVLTMTVAQGTGDAATTQYVYDAAGRLSSTTRAFGVAEASTTSYTYDGQDRLLTTTDPRGFITSRTYDALGQVITVTVPLDAVTNAVTTNQYDAFGNLVKVTDPRGAIGYFYYDKLDRLTLQVDPEGYATATTYSIGSEPLTVTRYYNKATGTGSVTTLPTVSAHAKDATTTLERDKLDRVTRITDAEGFYEQFTLNAFGDRLTVRNKLGGVTTNTYDKRGLLLTETLPVGSTRADGVVMSTTIVNKFEYDLRGNRTKYIEAFGLGEQRTTTFAYDKLDRLIQETGDAVTALQADFIGTQTVTPTQTIKYDLRGNIIESTAIGGARTLYYYNDLDRKVAEVNALGALSTWTYDTAGNAISARVYGDAVALPVSAGGTPPSPVVPANYRETTYAYDRNNRLISATIANLRTGQYSGGAYATSVGAVVIQTAYDAMGNVVRQIDGRGNSAWFFYDKLGRETARVDQENYLTTFVRDAEGNVLTEERFATRLAATVVATSDPAVLRTSVASNAADRVTTFTYDRNGRRITETRAGVAAHAVNAATGAMTTAATNATITYAYNGLGEVTRKTEANGDYVDYAYDLIGRQLSATDSAITDHTNASVQHRAETAYDALNNVTRTREGKVALDGAIDRISTFAYDIGGRLTATTDATGFTIAFAYDAAGNVARQSFTRAKSDDTTVNDALLSSYDGLGRATMQTTATWSGSAWVYGDRNHIRYNVYGEATGKGRTAGAVAAAAYQETFDYDAGGRLWKTNTGDGSTRLYLYDGAGKATLTINSTGTDLSGYATIEAALTGLGVNGATGVSALAGIAPTITVYDKRGQAITTRENFRELTATTTANIVRSQAYNAFGEVAQETDARGGVTDYGYNTMGRLVQKQSPTVNWTAENGAIAAARPTENYYYDLAGRLVGVRDANGNLNRRALLAGSGHGGEEAVVVAEFRAGGTDAVHSGVFRTGIDVFGDARNLTNELGYVELRDYDKAGRLITLTRPTRTATATTLVEHYTYDGLGQKLTHWNSQLGEYNRERTDYDNQGRIVRSESFGDNYTIVGGTEVWIDLGEYGGYWYTEGGTTIWTGDVTTYAYTWNASTPTTGLGVFGGWVKTTTHVSGRTATDTDDYFNRMVAHTDFGGHVFSYAFDKGGRLTGKTSNYGGNLVYSYFNTGNLAGITDLQAGYTTYASKALYGYDSAGNRTFESYVTTELYTYYDWEIGYTWTEEWEVSHQSATATYDALNRIISIDDVGGGGGAIALDYEYDKAGNVRHMTAGYTNLVSNTAVTQDYWYKYDSMNRFVTTKGVFTGTRGSGTITRGYEGLDIAYDAAGQRASATTSSSIAVDIGGTYYDDPWNGYYYEPNYVYYDGDHREDYAYTEDGYLSSVRMADSYWDYGTETVVTPTLGALRAIDVRDAMGRVTTHTEYYGDGVGVAYSRSSYFNNRSLLVSDSTQQKQSDGKIRYSTTTYDYNAESTPNSGYYTGAFQGGVVTHQRTTSYTTNANGGGYASQPTTDTKNNYVWWDSARQSSIVHKPNISQGATYTSSYSYDVNGHLNTVYVGDGRPRTIYFETDVAGQVTERYETSSAASNPRNYYYYFAGVKVGDNGNNGPSETDYASAIGRRTYNQTGAFRYGFAYASADFDQSYDPINPEGTRGAATSYTVNDGETLQSIARAVWGDESLWYLLAEANGVTSADALTAGMTLVIPNKVANFHNTSETFRVYDPNKAIGDTMPSQPKPPPKAKSGGCGGVGMIIVAIIAVVVVAIVAPYAIAAVSNLTGATVGMTASTVSGILAGTTAGTLSTTALVVGGAVAGAAGSIVSQAFAVATGIQDKFSWSAVAMAAIGGGVSAGVGQIGALKALQGAGNAAQNFGRAVVRGALSSAITQGVGVATGLQDKFNWTSVAVAGVASGVSNFVAGKLSAAGYAGDTMINQGVSGLAGGIAGAATRSLIDGSDFGDNILAVLPDIVASTIGQAIARSLVAKQTRTPEPAKPVATPGHADARSGMGGPYEPIDQGPGDGIPDNPFDDRRWIYQYSDEAMPAVISACDGTPPDVQYLRMVSKGDYEITVDLLVDGVETRFGVQSPDRSLYTIDANAAGAWTVDASGANRGSATWASYFANRTPPPPVEAEPQIPSNGGGETDAGEGAGGLGDLVDAATEAAQDLHSQYETATNDVLEQVEEQVPGLGRYLNNELAKVEGQIAGAAEWVGDTATGLWNFAEYINGFMNGGLYDAMYGGRAPEGLPSLQRSIDSTVNTLAALKDGAVTAYDYLSTNTPADAVDDIVAAYRNWQTNETATEARIRSDAGGGLLGDRRVQIRRSTRDTKIALDVVTTVAPGGGALKVGRLGRAGEAIDTASDASRALNRVDDVAEEAAEVSVRRKPYSDPTRRPKYAPGQVDKVWAKAKRDPQGNVLDPNTGEILTWDRTRSRAGQWDMGHRPGAGYKQLHDRYMSGELSLKEFLAEYRDPKNYRPESPSANRSHRYE